MMNQSPAVPSEKDCLNCEVLLPEGAFYCPNCGQKTNSGLISLKEFFVNFFDNVFNLNSRIVQTLKWLCIPAKLTTEYFRGRRKTYYHPIRLYLVLSLVMFAVLNTKDAQIVNFGDEESGFFEAGNKEKTRQRMVTYVDSVSQIILAQNNHPQARAALDSLSDRMPEPLKSDSIDFNLSLGTATKIDIADALTMDGKELVEKYKIEGFWNQIMVKQAVHLYHDRNAFSQKVASNLPILLLAIMPILALLLKILYFRRNRYYVEHLVLNFHHHAFAFLLFSLIFLLPEKTYPVLLPAGMTIVFLFLYLSMKRYYQQGHGKTFLKFTLFNFGYFFVFLIALAITFVISFFLF